uniref:Uncharacterized protein n=1 Tax=Setaria viridis TaxID=4556 RepID=A0A4V6DF36_SETVI|nr:hypothetical protein SEVIR_2G440600v2 [Setaria viridis]
MLRMKFPMPKDSPFLSGAANLAGEEKDDRAAAADSVVENGSLSPQRHRIDRGVRLGRPLAWLCASPHLAAAMAGTPTPARRTAWVRAPRMTSSVSLA